MLLEMAIGDAYGAGFEYAPIWQQALNTGSDYAQHPTHTTVRPGMYTDDTQMAIGLAEHLVEHRGVTPVDFAETFVRTYQRDRRDGYNQGFQALLGSCRTGQELLARIQPNSHKNGGAMRSAPLGVLSDPIAVIGYTSTQAAVTHNTPEGTGGAITVALSAHYFLYRLGPKEDLLKFVTEHMPVHLRAPMKLGHLPWDGSGVGSSANEAVRAALTAVLEETSLSGVLTRCVGFGGDTDTVAAIGMALASCVEDMVSDLAPTLLNGLERSRYGSDYIKTLDAKLLALVAR